MFWSSWSFSKPVAPAQAAPQVRPRQAEQIFQGASRGAKHLESSKPVGLPVPLEPQRGVHRSSNVLGSSDFDSCLEAEDDVDDVHSTKPRVWMGHGDRNDALSADIYRTREELRRVMLELEDRLTSLFRSSEQVVFDENAELRSRLRFLGEENSRLRMLLETSGKFPMEERVNGTFDQSGGEHESTSAPNKSDVEYMSRVHKSSSIQWGEEIRLSSNSVQAEDRREDESKRHSTIVKDDMEDASTGSKEWEISQEGHAADAQVVRGRSNVSLVSGRSSFARSTELECVQAPSLGPTPDLSIDERNMQKVWKAWCAVVRHGLVSKRQTTESRARASDLRGTRSVGSRNCRYDLHQFWKDAGETVRKSKKSAVVQRPSANSFTSGGGGKTMKIKRMDKAMAEYSKRNRIFLLFVQNPLSPRRMLWELLGIGMIIYDMIAIPLQVFDTPWDGVSTVMAWTVTVYWTLDIPGSFLVGFHVDGVLEVRASKMIWHYVSSWFIPDVAVITFDWILLISDMQDSNKVDHMSYIKAGRSLRVLRFLRLIRLLKLRGVLTKILERITSEYVLTLVRVLKLLLFIVTINHFVACAWYGIGEENDSSWVRERFDQNDAFGYRYATSLHWSFTQFTPASMEVTPTNFGERLFAVFVIVIALVAFSSFVSSITEAMTRLRNLNAQRAEQQSQLRRYFGENRIPPQAQTRVWRFLERAAMSQRRKRQMWQDVFLVQKLPEILQMELKTEAYNPTLSGYPFFHQYGDIDPVAMRAICHTAVTESSLTQGQDVFQRGQASTRMFFVREGDLDYILQDMMWNDYVKATLFEGQWAAEACCWIKWFHTGSMKARHDAQVFELQVALLHHVMLQYHELLLACQRYATLFWQRCKDFDEPISDVDAMDFDDLQSSAQQAFQDTMGEDWDAYSEDEDEFGNIVVRISSSLSARDNNRLSWTSNVSNMGVSLTAAMAKKFRKLF